jgi:pimeloyl-ACP methyl ester carboxylesterase
MPYVQTKDKTALYYYDWGTGTPVVLVHGWPLTSASWEGQARVLAESGYRVIAYDRRGFGRSDWAGTGYDYDTLADDLSDLMETLDVQGATLVGFSMGGGEVAHYLARHGAARVNKAVLVSAVTPYLLKTDDNPEGVDRKVFDGIVEAIGKDKADFMKTFSKSFYGYGLVKHPVSQAQLEFWQGMAATGSPLATVKLVRSWSETDFRGDLAKITIPTLVIHGTSDQTVPIDVSGRRAVSLLANAELLEYDGEPHGLNVTAAKRLNDDLLAFLGRAPATAAL